MDIYLGSTKMDVTNLLLFNSDPRVIFVVIFLIIGIVLLVTKKSGFTNEWNDPRNKECEILVGKNYHWNSQLGQCVDIRGNPAQTGNPPQFYSGMTEASDNADISDLLPNRKN